MKYLLILITILFIYNSNAQPFKQSYKFRTNPKMPPISFDYNSIISDLKGFGTKSQYYEEDFIRALLYLDRSSLRVIKGINPNFLEEFKYIDTSFIFSKVQKNKINEYYVKVKNLKDFFKSRKLWLRIVKPDYKYTYILAIRPFIYIKDNKLAIFEVNDDTKAVTYKVKLEKNKIRVEKLYSCPISIK